MRRVTVRVAEDGDWQFRAERADGRLIFELQSVDDGTAAPADATVLSLDPSDRPAVPWHAGEFGNMVGPPNEDWDQSLFTLRDMVELALPHPQGARVVEIGAGSGETTVAYARDWRGIPDVALWLVDPGEYRQLLDFNVTHHVPFANILPTPAIEEAQNLSKQDLSLLILSAKLTRAEQVALVKAWLRHLVSGGRIVVRKPIDGEHFALGGYSVDQSGEWMLYSPAEEGGGYE